MSVRCLFLLIIFGKSHAYVDRATDKKISRHAFMANAAYFSSRDGGLYVSDVAGTSEQAAC